IQFYLFSEGLYVIAANAKYRELLGAEILRIEDRKVSEVLAALEPLISRDNDHWPSEVIPYQMRFPGMLKGLGLLSDSRQVTLTVRDLQGQERAVVLPAQSTAGDLWNRRPYPRDWVGLSETLTEPVPLYLKNVGANYWFEHLRESRLVYCQYN